MKLKYTLSSDGTCVKVTTDFLMFKNDGKVEPWSYLLDLEAAEIRMNNIIKNKAKYKTEEDYKRDLEISKIVIKMLTEGEQK